MNDTRRRPALVLSLLSFVATALFIFTENPRSALSAKASTPSRQADPPVMMATRPTLADAERHSRETPYPNKFCVGKAKNSSSVPAQGSDTTQEPDNGNGFICTKALGQDKCTTPAELASIYCACCQCYVQCGMSHTEWAVCKHDGTCDEPSTP
ncbi:hypothetical protein T492DRAFT_1034936 [Pavlovales sp. CCMP2436]|nr:hypothetical protein T492DRAFT_1034936 [Pavlovales sp. CCMP2436]|eukprot:CAMPEP_0179886426 /NCGR_PEP_ID=MMETSP0982-20121206/30838_1 /TAXON_ID=483367 /ORGANISM="non described non described, Strain CCMP 2436" /LENGTH=153 /DNA_ID=CAMNT_0021782133 /DNA_START=1 /DNA_END=465 /DNA_ORIENTATION=-